MTPDETFALLVATTVDDLATRYRRAALDYVSMVADLTAATPGARPVPVPEVPDPEAFERAVLVTVARDAGLPLPRGFTADPAALRWVGVVATPPPGAPVVRTP